MMLRGVRVIPLVLACLVLIFSAAVAFEKKILHPIATPVEFSQPLQPVPGLAREHVDQRVLWVLVKDGMPGIAFESAFARGDEFFDNLFRLDQTFGVGARVGRGQKFSRIPRADLNGHGEWATHIPKRVTGPNAMSCVECHTQAEHDGGGFVASNVIRDPLHSANLAYMVQRNTPHLFGSGAIQLLAQEMTEDLRKTLDEAKTIGCDEKNSRNITPVTRRLLTHGIDFGWIQVQQITHPDSSEPDCQVITHGVSGVDPDLVVRPFQWKGVVSDLRSFVRGAAHNEMGLQAVELVGEGVDGDADGVSDELSVGDITALTVYVASQPRPVSKIELAARGWVPPMEYWEKESIDRGRRAFQQIGCSSCHTPLMAVKNSVFSEPSQNRFYRDQVFPSGVLPESKFLDPEFPIRLDLTLELGFGTQFERDADGSMKIELFSDLKRHDLGPELTETIDEAGTGSSTWLTRPLWGVGSTPPYLHDGRATTIREAIEFHGGEGASSRAQFRSLSAGAQDDLDRFLMNLRLWKAPEKMSLKVLHETQ